MYAPLRAGTLGRIASVALLLGLCCTVSVAQAQKQGELVVITATNNPLPSLAEAAAFTRVNPPVILFNEVPNFSGFRGDTRAVEGAENLGADPLLQPFSPSVPTTVLTQFDGADNTDNGANVTPPDTDGDVSSDAVDRYVQMINIVTTVFDKSGAIAPGGAPFFSNAFWNGFGGLCESNNNGDPIVLYDETNDRWLVSQFAFNSTSSPPWLQCVAISQTSDPLGAYNRYAFDFGAIGFPDYPKHGIVTNSITLFAHLFAPSYIGSFIGAADKACMYAGNPSCTLVGANVGITEGGFAAGDLDDPTGTAGVVPALFATDSNASGLFDVWEVDPDFVTPSNSTVTRIERVPIASFDSDICPAFRERCVPHPGSGDDLETLSDRLMHRLQLRDFGTHLSMVTSRTVDVDAAPSGGNGRTGIRWYELRSTDGGANWSLHQEGTHGPADGLDRWMPSIAMNAAGDIGVGYMVASATTPVEIRVTGQTAASSGTGSFDADEVVCRAGVAGSDWSGRSGDYSATNVDPNSDTFWHTNEFGRSSTFRGWGTAVCEYELVGGPVNQPPVVTITAPADGASFNQGDPVTFTGTANDNEDGDISASIAWSSNLDGALGTGASITTSSLSVGTHTITASATDSGTPTGTPQTGTDQISVTITGPSPTTMHVHNNVVTGTQGGGKKKNGTATVTIFDNFEGPVANATVTVQFSGDFNETISGTTNGSGVVTVVTAARVRNPVFSACVDNVAHASLTYDANDNENAGSECNGGGTPTSVHVENVSTGQQGAGGGNKRGTATITLHTDLGGNPGASYTITGNFSGDFTENGVSGTTDGSGSVTVTTSGTKKGKVNVDFCVSSVSGGALPYNSGDDTPGTTCTPLTAGKGALAGEVPDEYALESNFPNPFNPSTVIAYALAEAGPVTLRVYNVLGQEVATLVDGYKESGRHEVVFDASRLSAGVYLYVIEAGSFTATQRMTLLK